MAIEEPRYTVESKTVSYEIRSYGSVLIAETTIEASFDDAGNRAFRILADYIFGNNRSKTKLAMTAPVNQVHTIGGFLVQFTMPVGFTLATLPEPNDSRVHLREIPAHRVAVKAYTGSWSEAHYQRKLAELRSALKRDGVRTTGEPVFARFNSPFQIWFLRRNEIWIEVAP